MTLILRGFVYFIDIRCEAYYSKESERSGFGIRFSFVSKLVKYSFIDSNEAATLKLWVP